MMSVSLVFLWLCSLLNLLPIEVNLDQILLAPSTMARLQLYWMEWTDYILVMVYFSSLLMTFLSSKEFHSYAFLTCLFLHSCMIDLVQMDFLTWFPFLQGWYPVIIHVCSKIRPNYPFEQRNSYWHHHPDCVLICHPC